MVIKHLTFNFKALLAMTFLKNLFSTSRAPKTSKAGSRGRGSQADGLDGTHGHETLPVKMNLDERMAFRRELLYETIHVSLKSRFIAANTYRFKVMRTDKRGHCFIVMLDMSPTFMASPAGKYNLLKETAALLIKNAEIKYGLLVSKAAVSFRRLYLPAGLAMKVGDMSSMTIKQ